MNRSNGTSGRLRNSREKNDFHPKLIFAQIVALQSVHYFLLALCLQINHVLYNTSITIDRIFTHKYVHIWHASGWPDIMAIMLTSLAGSVLLAIVVEKSKKCLDFAITLFLVHLVIITLYNGFPASFDWWIVHVFATICMVLLGEYICSRKEMEDIPLLQL